MSSYPLAAATGSLGLQQAQQEALGSLDSPSIRQPAQGAASREGQKEWPYCLVQASWLPTLDHTDLPPLGKCCGTVTLTPGSFFFFLLTVLALTLAYFISVHIDLKFANIWV